MIARLRGTLVEVEADAAVIEVGGPPGALGGGVGYLVRMGARALSRLPAPGEPVVVAVESRTAEDGTTLYGFASRDERAVFNILTAIQGVGPKAALSVLDVLPPSELAAAVAREDKAAVSRANGVGAKLAVRIVTELRGKPLGAGLAAGASTGFGASEPAAPPTPTLAGEATAALMGLGLAEPLARRAVDAAAPRLAPDADLSDWIKAALQESGR